MPGLLPKYKLNSGLPSSAQAPVELYQGQSLIELSLYQAEFGGEIVSFVGKDFEITRNTAAISHVREARCVLCGGKQELYLLTKLLGLAICDQGIGNIPECSLDGLFVAQQERLLPGFGPADIRSQLARREDRLGQRSAKVPQSRRSGE